MDDRDAVLFLKYIQITRLNVLVRVAASVRLEAKCPKFLSSIIHNLILIMWERLNNWAVDEHEHGWEKEKGKGEETR